MMLRRLIARFMPHLGQDAAADLEPLREQARRSHREASDAATSMILALDDHREAMDAVGHRIECRCAGTRRRHGPDAIVAATATVADLARKHRKP